MLLMSLIREKCHYTAVKKIISIIRRSNMKVLLLIFFCFNCFRSFKTKNNLESQKKRTWNKSFCGAVMSTEDTKTLAFNQYQIFDETAFIIYADFESLSKKCMDVKTILKYHLQRMQVNIFYQVFQCLQYHYLKK